MKYCLDGIIPILIRCCCVLTCIAWIGCGSGETVYHLSGTVTFKDKPVPEGNIVFEPDGSKGNRGAPGMSKIKDGKYDTRQVDGRGVVGGPHLVRIVGIDGKPSGNEKGEILQGTPLFPEYEVAEDLPKEHATKDFVIK